jgi:hypothetical protein
MSFYMAKLFIKMMLDHTLQTNTSPQNLSALFFLFHICITLIFAKRKQNYTLQGFIYNFFLKLFFFLRIQEHSIQDAYSVTSFSEPFQ